MNPHEKIQAEILIRSAIGTPKETADYIANLRKTLALTPVIRHTLNPDELQELDILLESNHGLKLKHGKYPDTLKTTCEQDVLYAPFSEVTSTELTAAKSVKASYQLFFDKTPTSVCITDEFGLMVDVNQAFERLSGYKRDEIIGSFVGIFFSNDSIRGVSEIMDQHRLTMADSNDHSSLITFKKKDGNLVFTTVISRSIEDLNGKKLKVSTLTDSTIEYSANLINTMLLPWTTEDVQVELAPPANYHRTLISKRTDSSAVPLTSLAIWDYSISDKEVLWTEGFENIFGIKSSYHSSDADEWIMRVHPQDQERVLSSFKEHVDDPKQNLWKVYYRFRRGNNTYAECIDAAVIYRNEDGEATRVIGVLRDITNIQRLESVHRLASELARIGSWEVDLTTGKLYWSEMTRKIHEVADGYVPEVERAIQFYKEGFAQEAIAYHYRDAIKNGSEWDLEVPIITAKGREVWVRSMGKPQFEDGKCVRVSGCFQDIDARKRSEHEVQRKKELLSSLSAINKLLLRIDDWDETLQEVFNEVATVIKADRIYYFGVDQEDSGTKVLNHRAEWCREGFIPQIDNPNLKGIPLDQISNFIDRLVKARHLNVVTRTYPDEIIRNYLFEQNVAAALMTSVTTNGEFCGMIGFDDCETERMWSEEEKEFLITINDSISTALEKHLTAVQIKRLLHERDTILESITDGFVTIDRAWRFTYVNRTAIEVIGIPKEELIGQFIQEIFPIEQYADSYLNYRKAMNDAVTSHFTIQRADIGRWFEISVYPHKEGIAIYFRDVSIKIKSEQSSKISNERFELISEFTNDAIWDWDIESGTLFWSKGFQELFGYDVHSSPPTIDTWAEMVHPEDRDEAHSSLHRAMINSDCNRWVAEYRFRKADGTYAFTVDRGGVVRNENGEATRMVGTMIDLTERKRQQEALEKLNDQLITQARQLEISNSELEQFAYVASHDLQEPLRMVTSFLKQIERKYAKQLDEQGREYINFAVDGAKRMRQIILDLLDYSRLIRFDAEPEKVDLNELINDIEHLNSELIKENNASIVRDDLPVLHTFKAPIQQIFQNLIHNAIKYRKSDVAPVVKISYTELLNGLQLTIADNGIGINEKHFDRIFGIFQRLHNKLEYAGTGMGLSIVKKIVENIGGNVSLESTENVGTTFFIMMPYELLYNINEGASSLDEDVDLETS